MMKQPYQRQKRFCVHFFKAVLGPKLLQNLMLLTSQAFSNGLHLRYTAIKHCLPVLSDSALHFVILIISIQCQCGVGMAAFPVDAFTLHGIGAHPICHGLLGLAALP